MSKHKLEKRFGYMNQLMAKVKKILIEDNNFSNPNVKIGKGILEEISSTWERIKNDSKRIETFCPPIVTPEANCDSMEKGNEHPYVRLESLKEE